jgi:uncharacterized protein
MSFVLNLLQSGLGNLASYLAAHVLLCLVPAFFIAGALTALVPKEAVTRYLGRSAPKFISYPASAVGGFVLAVCSCTIMPLFAGIYKKGAGLGPAITFLFVGPAINILALTYTGVAIGMDIAVARVVLSIAFGIGIGLIMAVIFRKEDVARSAPARSVPARDSAGPDAFAATASVPRATWLLLGLLILLLVAGTLQVGLFTDTYAQVTLPIGGTDALQATLNRLVPFDASRGEEGVTVQGLLLIVLLAAIGGTAWRGLNHIDEGFNRWTTVALALAAATLLVAALRLIPGAAGVTLAFTGKFFAVALAVLGIWLVARRRFEDYEIQEWLWETWRFVKQIFPLLIVGVFAVGVVRPLIRPEWIEAVAGSNTLLGNVVGVLFGVVMYFPTLVEVPIARLFLDLGMHRGPLLAYLMADPELSLQSILIISSVIGRRKAWVYVGWVALFSTLAGLLFGAWVDGANPWLLLGGTAAGLSVLALVLARLGKGASEAGATPQHLQA